MDINNGVAADAPSPPPPPSISSHEGHSLLEDDSQGWSKFKQIHTPSPTVERSPAFPRSRHDRLGHSASELILFTKFSILFTIQTGLHRLNVHFLCAGENDLSQNEDTDMRLPINGLESSSNPKFNDILARAAEQVKNGTMTPKDFEEVQFQVKLPLNNNFCVPHPPFYETTKFTILKKNLY